MRNERTALSADVAPPRPLTVEGLLREDRIVVLAVPLTSATHELINAERLALMPPGAVLVNVGRGSTVDEQALASALAPDASPVMAPTSLRWRTARARTRSLR